MKYAICGATIFDGEHFLQDHCVILDDTIICEVIASAKLPNNLPRKLLSGGILAPGFIDLQVNGGGGVMLNDQASVGTITAAHRRSGTTGLLPTILSDELGSQQARFHAVQAARAAGNLGVLGVHIEGPFFDLKKRGAHAASKIRRLQPEDMKWLLSLEKSTVIVTLAPEHTLPGQIRQLCESGIYVCAGHTDALFEQIQDAIQEGLRGFTHLFNAMSPLTTREPGAVGAALDSDSSWVGIIADGHHVHPANIRIAHKLKPPGKTLLVSDAMATVGSDQNRFELYGETITEKNGRLVNSRGVLAGSAIGMIDAVRYVTTQVNIPLHESLRMAALYPAEFLRRDTELGRIASNYRADLVHFDDDYTILATWLAGQHQCHHEKLPHQSISAKK